MLKKVFQNAALVTLLCWAILCCGGCFGGAPRKPGILVPGDYRYTIDYSEYRIQKLMSRHHLPSVAVALIDDQCTVWQGVFGWAKVEDKIPARSDTVYKVWSVSKVFTALETMRLVEEGLVDLDAPITDCIPDFSIQSRFPDSGPITIRSILAHHSGLPRNECHSLTVVPGDPNALAEMVKSMADCHMAFPVGTRYKYSNIGPNILGYTIQEFRGESFSSYMKESLLDRIGMVSSGFLSADVPAQRDRAMGYEYYKGKYYPYEQGDIAELSSGNLYSTLEDMAVFVKFLFRDGEADGEQIIDPATLHMMFENQFASERDPQPMGLGWKITHALNSELMVWHDGGPGEGIGALVAFLPERELGVVLFANSTSFDGRISVPLAIEILELMLETKYGVLPPEERIARRIKVERSQLEDYAGKYIAFGEVMDVSRNGNRLKGKITGIGLDLIAVEGGRFRVSHWLLKFGVGKLFHLPIDFSQLGIEFLVGDEGDKDVMIINFGDIFYEVCPRYPDVEEVPDLWNELAGDYDRVARLPSGGMGADALGRSRIWIEDDVLQMGGLVGPILPINETEIVIQSGPFAGETMDFDPGTGNICHQLFVYKPTRTELSAGNR